MKTPRFQLLLTACLFFFSLISAAQSQMIADITGDIETDFGVYHPYTAIFIPDAPMVTVEPDFKNVENFSEVAARNKFTFADSVLLMQNHFTVKKSRETKMHDIYNNCPVHDTPMFVTTDAVLHIYHEFFDRMLSDIEAETFIEKLNRMTDVLLANTRSVYDQAVNPEIKESARLNLAYFSVAKKLLQGDEVTVDEEVADLVNAELDLITQHLGFQSSPILGEYPPIDYSQFVPRGHYTKSETLETYFKTMMWYGRSTFLVGSELSCDVERRHTLQAILIVQALYSLVDDGHTLIEHWDDIYEPTVFFVGKTDDPNVRDYFNIAVNVYGSHFLELSPDSLVDVVLFNEFMAQARNLPEPQITNYIIIDGRIVTYKGFRLMGQRFVPDSYMFSHLVGPEIPNRYFPKGLDVMAVLGSDRAYEILDSFYGQTQYENYSQTIADFKAEFSAKTSAEWAQNLYWNWLYCLMPLLYEKGDGYPVFMQTDAWSDKELLTALASWTELRHDTILYAKQSMGVAGNPHSSSFPKSYVEPNPYLYARLASLVRYTYEGLESRGLFPDAYREQLNQFETLLIFLRDISIKELENSPLSEQDYENIYCFGKIMKSFLVDLNYQFFDLSTDKMVVVADVHTDLFLNQCLEEGVGYPLEIYVIVNEGGSIRLTKGAIFSYYEFTQPIADRLTDESWHTMLDSDASPEMPGWVSNFMEVITPSPEMSQYPPLHYFEGTFEEVKNGITDTVPATIQLCQNYPNPFNSTTTIKFNIQEKTRVTLSIYNIIGQKIITLCDVVKIPGSYTMSWDGRDSSGRNVSSGMYLCKLETGGFLQVKRMFLLR